MQDLILRDNQLTGAIPPELGRLRRQLRHLDLANNRLTGTIPPELGNLNKLQELLRRLDLSDNRLTGPIPVELGNLSELDSLSIFGNPLTGPLPRELIGLPLTLFHWHDTDLCAPTDDNSRNGSIRSRTTVAAGIATHSSLGVDGPEHALDR